MASSSQRNLVTNLYLVQQWWDSRVGRSILSAIRKWTKSKGKSERVSYVNDGGSFWSVIDEKVSKELADTYDSLMKTLYQKEMVDFVVGFDFDPSLDIVYLFLDSSASKDSVDDLMISLREKFQGTRLMSVPKDTEGELEEGLYMILMSKEALPVFDLSTQHVPSEGEDVLSGEMEVIGAAT